MRRRERNLRRLLRRPGQIATHSFGSAANRGPWIRGNAQTLTTIWGETF